MSDVLHGGRPNGRKGKIDLKKTVDDPLSFEAQLTPEEIEAIREKARSIVRLELAQRQEAALLAQFTAEERKALDPRKQTQPIFLSLAGHSEYIMLDGTQFFHGQTYEVTGDVFMVLTEQMNRGWAHEDETEVRDKRSRQRFRPPLGLNFSNFGDNRRPRDLVMSSEQLAGASPAALLGVGR